MFKQTPPPNPAKKRELGKLLSGLTCQCIEWNFFGNLFSHQNLHYRSCLWLWEEWWQGALARCDNRTYQAKPVLRVWKWLKWMPCVSSRAEWQATLGTCHMASPLSGVFTKGFRNGWMLKYDFISVCPLMIATKLCTTIGYPVSSPCRLMSHAIYSGDGLSHLFW